MSNTTTELASPDGDTHPKYVVYAFLITVATLVWFVFVATQLPA